MLRCIELAQLGAGKTSPNPMVGSVIVYEDKIIGEGWHQRYGGPHAEVNAVASVKDKQLLSKSTIYVSLEPCAHYGKTPPCVELIISNKIPKVVIGTHDPNPKVSGKSVALLKSKGIDVKVGVLESEALAIDKAFFKSFNQKQPYVVLKYAVSKEGYFAPKVGQQWLSNAMSKRFSHKLRHDYDAILVGSQTIRLDQPQLNNRFWGNKQPIKVLIQGKQTIENLATLIGDAKAIVFNTERNQQDGCIKYIQLDYPFAIDKMLTALNQNGINSLLVEGGSNTLQNFINVKAWDKAYIYRTPTTIENGIVAPNLKNSILTHTIKIDNNEIEIYSQ